MLRKIRRLFKARRPGMRRFPSFVTCHLTANIDKAVSFCPHGDDCIVIGQSSIVWRNCEMSGPITIGSGVFLNREVYIRPFTTIEDEVSVGPFVKFITDTHEVSDVRKRAGRHIFQPIKVEHGAWIGAGAMILGGVTIGHGSIVAAGAVVKRNVPPNTLVGGVPAKVIRELNPLTGIKHLDSARLDSPADQSTSKYFA